MDRMYDQDCKELILNPATIKTTMSPSPTTTSFNDRFSPPFKSENNALKNRCSTTTLHQTREYGNGSGFLYAPQQELYDNMLGSGLDCIKTIRHPDAGSFLHHSHLMAQNASSAPSANNARLTNQMAHATLDTLDMMEAALSAGSVPSLTQMTDHHHHPAFTSHGSHVGFHGTVYSSHAGSGSHPHTGLMVHPLPHHPGHHHLHPGIPIPIHDMDSDPRELEAFAERFKQRRIRLGVTQADVGRALANLRIPGVGSLSQSTICRFESLTLSHNNMIALKPILHAWLEEAEAQAREKPGDPENPSVLPSAEKKRKRTSIANPEKRSLEAFFAVQPRPSAEKIAAIAEKLDLKKNVVRVWFCNQRQKQKRLKFSTQHP